MTAFVRRRIFLKYISVTLLLGVLVNAFVLAVYYEYRQAEQVGQLAAEIATVAHRIGRPAAALAREGDDRRARELLSLFAAYSYAICADLHIDGDEVPASSWPVVGCERIEKSGREMDIALPGAGSGAKMHVRIDPNILAAALRAEFLVLAALGVVGGLALILAGVGAFLWYINRPLSQLLKAIERFESHDDPEQVAYHSEDEIGKVIASYNMMLDREVERVSAIREAHRSILDSVTYATRIQRGLLPTENQLANAFAESSVLWHPRDLVGGDIYWIRTHGPHTTVVLIDCTGHGIPGGFMTMLAIATLERIFAEDEDLSPGKVLTRLSDLTRGLLNQDAANPNSNDGMDAAICRIDSSSGEGIFAGARLSLALCSGGRAKRIRGDSISLGYADVPARPHFKETTFPTGPNTKLFLTTDGVTDQIGGPRRIAFGYRRFIDIVEAQASKSLDDILGALERELSEYAGNEARRDDLAVIAFRPGAI